MELFDLDRSASLGQSLSDLGLFSRPDTLEAQREASERGVFEADSIELAEIAEGPRTVHIGVVSFDDGERRLLLWSVTERRSPNRPTPPDCRGGGQPEHEARGGWVGSPARSPPSFNNLLSPIIGLAEMGLLETSPGNAQYSDFRADP